MKFGAGIGLLSLLIVVAIMFYLFAGPTGPGGSSYGGTLAEKNREAREDVNRFAGQGVDGRRMSETLTLEPFPERGPMRGVRVVTIEADGTAATNFGLQVGDVIRQIGPNELGGPIITSVDAANDFIDDAFARGMKLTIERDGVELVLPEDTVPSTPGPALPGGLDGLLDGAGS